MTAVRGVKESNSRRSSSPPESSDGTGPSWSNKSCAARCELEAQRRRVLNDVQIAACRVLADQERIAILLELKKINEEVVGACEALLEAKELGRTDLLKAQIELETTTMRLRVEERELSGTRRALAGVVGRGDLADIRVAGSLREELPLLDWDASLECLYQNSPELRRAYASVAENAMRRSPPAHRPQVGYRGRRGRGL